MSPLELSIAALAAAAAGAVNALAGGGTLISFPVLLALGIPPIAANVTNAVALSPGYLGATLAQLGNLRGQRERLLLCIPAAVIGGLVGAVILLHTRERTFVALVPYMLFFAAVLLAFQNRVRAWVVRRLAESRHAHHSRFVPVIAVAAAGVYGGFFTAGMSVLVLAILGATVEDSLTRLNALKQIIAFSVNIAAAVFFLFSDQLIWLLAGVMALGAMVGGALGGRVASRLNPDTLRWIVVVVGVALAIFYWFRN
ncbi:sulfite exporter TauE/SafE family protein [Povalibacter sp.]|uniref:sulfite exporter TauE/SafE family protein n=1 Tax=Povalibacter sp. TaxID=1962978 RepID=UPI002F41C30B